MSSHPLNYLVLLLVSFLFNLASVFTAVYSRYLGDLGGQLLSTVLRNVLGIPTMGVAFVLAARLPSPRLLAPNRYIDFAGWSFLLAGALLILWALISLRLRAAAPSVSDSLVRHGPYAHVRHPLYDGVFFELAGAVLLRPTLPMVLSCLLTAGWMMVQAVAEEFDLLARVPGYREYMEQVPGFIPRILKS